MRVKMIKYLMEWNPAPVTRRKLGGPLIYAGLQNCCGYKGLGYILIC